MGWRYLATLLRGRDDSFGNTLLKIAMTHPLSNLRVRTLTINSGDVPPRTYLGTYPPLSIKPCLDIVIWQLLTIYSDDSCRCGLKLWQLLTIYSDDSCRCDLKLYTVTKNSDDILTRACLGRYPLKHVWARTPHLEHVWARTSPTCQSNCLNITSFSNVLLLFIAMTHAGCGLKFMFFY